jgi:hypothetical protein
MVTGTGVELHPCTKDVMIPFERATLISRCTLARKVPYFTLPVLEETHTLEYKLSTCL